MKKLWIKRLNIINFRNIQNLVLIFDENFNLIEGMNGTGKTTILDAIRFIVFNKNDQNKKVDNYKTIKNGDSINKKESAPNIELELVFDNKEIILKVANKEWSINGIVYKTVDHYKTALANILGLQNIDVLFPHVHPSFLSSILLTQNADAKTFRDEIIQIINLNLDSDNQIINFDQIVENKRNANEECEEIKKHIKFLKNNLENFEKANPNITNWEISNKNGAAIELEEINNKIRNYNLLKAKIENAKDQIDRLNNEKYQLKSTKHNSLDNNKTNKPKWLIILMSIFTFGLYYYFYKRKINQIANQKNNLVQNEYRIKEIENKITKFKVELDNLLNNDNYKNIDFAILSDRKKQLEENNYENSYINSQKNKHEKMVKEIKHYENKKEAIESNHTHCEHAYLEALNKIQNCIHNYFGDFEFSLFDEKSDTPKIVIKENGIELKYLNYANKHNIFCLINQFIKQKNKINCFNLIDQAESFNKLALENSDTQTIACKVSDATTLKLNGKHIN